jgi:hypothetical protein
MESDRGRKLSIYPGIESKSRQLTQIMDYLHYTCGLWVEAILQSTLLHFDSAIG